MARWWPWILVGLALSPALLVHAAAPPSAPLGPRRSVVSIAVFDNPTSVVPATAATLSGRMVGDNVFQTLFRLGPHGTVRPNLAQSALASGTTVTVVLSHRRLTSGQRVTAALVKAALSSLLAPGASTAATRRLLGAVVGSGHVESGRASEISGISALGNNRLVFHLKAPASGFIATLANPALAVVPPADLAQGASYWQATNLIGSGGYTLTQWEPGALMNFEAAGRPRIDVTRFPSWVEAWHAFQNGGVDAVPVTVAERATIPAAARHQLTYLLTGGSLELMVNPLPGSPWATASAHAALKKVGLARWVRVALGGRVPPSRSGFGALSAFTAPATGTPVLPLAVDEASPEAVALANALTRLLPGRFQITELPAGALRRAWASGAVAAALVAQNVSDPWAPPAGGHAVAVPIAPSGVFWLLGPGLAGSEAYPDGALNWSTLP